MTLRRRFVRAFFQGIWGAVADKIFEGAVIVAGVIWFFLTNGFSLNKLRASSWETVAVVVWTASVLVVWHSYRSAYAVSQDIKHEIGFAHNYSYAVPKLYTMATSLTIAAVLASLGAWKLSSNTPPRESQPTNALPHIPSASEIADEMDKRKSATKSDAVQPQKQAPKVQIIFKNSPLFTKIRRDRISNTIDGCYLYLYRLGFPVKNELAPIGVVPGAAFRASGTYPGTIYDRQILLPEKSLDDPNRICRAYADDAFADLLKSREPDHIGTFDEQAVWVYSIYFASSHAEHLILKITNSDSLIDRWLKKLWAIRERKGKTFVDNSLLYAFRRWNEPRNNPKDFDDFFRIRLELGIEVEANDISEALEINKIIAEN